MLNVGKNGRWQNVDKMMGLGKMDQTWVPSMPPLLSSDLDSIWTTWKKLWHCALTRKKFENVKKLGKKI